MITIKTIVDEDFVNYKKPSMFIAFPKCTWKCEKECGQRVCQNGKLAATPNIEIDAGDIVGRYISNPITSAVVLGGLEPFDSWYDLYDLIEKFRKASDDDIVIYTGYTKEELQSGWVSEAEHQSHIRKTFYELLTEIKNIIIKYGRYVPNQKPHYDDVLGICLASDNQYAEKIN